MKLGSLFDGSGTAPLAASMCGIEPVWASEIEPYPIAVTKARFPNMKHLGSILDIKGGEIEPVDIICGGSPCQDLSVAGAQKGLIEGERSNLFFEMIRIIKEMRNATNGKSPRWIIWENVPGAFSSNKGKDFLEVLRQYSALADPNVYVPEPQGKDGKLAWRYAGNIVGNGWSLAWRTVDAQYWGVPQRRRRIYLVLDLGSERAGEILFERNSLCGDSAQGSETGEGTPTDAEGSSGGSCIAFKERAGKPGGGKGILPCDGTSFTLATNADQNVCYENQGKCLNPWDAQSKHIQPIDGKSEALCSGEKRWGSLPPNVCYAVATQQGGAEMRNDNKCPTITAAAGTSGNNQPYLCYPVEAFGHDERSTQFAKDGCCDSLVASDYKQPISVAYQTVAIEGNGTRESHQGDGYAETDKMYTLNTIERHAVCYGIEGNTVDRNSQKNGSGISQDVCPTLNTQDHHAVCYKPTSHNQAVACDMYNGAITGDVTPNLNASSCSAAGHSGPSVLIYREGSFADYEPGVGTLRAAGGTYGGGVKA